ncbi:MAG: hypothetical protein F4X31_02410, partial [Gammaproteobacteria bacterium]|nr:hypothetical protein [Gammaproteobacteria bacterium]
GTLSFAAGDTSKTVEVAVNGDTLDESNETVKLRLSSPANAGFAGDAAAIEATGTIEDDDGLPVVSIADAAAEEGYAMTFTLRLNAASGRDMTVQWATADDAGGSNPAAADEDYTAVGTARTATIKAGATTTAVTVDTLADVRIEPDETFLVRLSDPVNATLSPTASEATGTITDNRVPTLAISGVPPKINASDDLTATFTFSEAVTGFVIGDVNVSGAAKKTFSGSGTTYTLVVTPDGDADVIVTVPANAVTDGVNNAPTAAVSETAVWDGDAPTVAISGVPNTINSTATFQATFTFSEDVSGFETGDVTVSGGTKGMFGSTDAGTYTLGVTPNDGEDVTVTVLANTATDGLSTGPPENVAATAAWDSTAPSVTIADASATEGDALTFSVTLDRAVPGGLTVTPGFTDGTATKGTDYTENTAALTFAGTAGETQTFTVATIEDALAEGDETFTLGLTVSGTTVTVTATDTGTGTINDDDERPTSITLTVDADMQTDGAQDEVAEDGGKMTVQVTATVDGPARFAGDTVVRVSVGSQGDSALQGKDYVAVPDFDCTIPAGEASGSVTFTMTLIDDNLDEVDEMISLNGEMTDTTVMPAQMRVTDDEPSVTVGWGPADETTLPLHTQWQVVWDEVSEGESGTFVLYADPAPEQDLRVAIDVTDFGGFLPPGGAGRRTVTIPAGATTRTVTVPTEDDEVVETYWLDGRGHVGLDLAAGPGYRLADPSGDQDLWGRRDAVLFVRDNDAEQQVTVSFASGDANVEEGGNAHRLSLRAAPESQDLGPYWIGFRLSGTATPGVDYELAKDPRHSTDPPLERTDNRGKLWMNSAIAAPSMMVTVLDDGIDDDGETIVVTLQAGAGYDVGEPATVTLTIGGSDTGPTATPALALSETALAMTEGGEASYTVSLATQPTETVTVSIAGHAGTDLTLDKTSLTFETSDWSDPQTVNVSAGQDDDASDDTETLALAASGGGYDAAADVSVTVTDDDEPALVLSATTLDVAEGDRAQYSVRLATQPAASVTVAIAGHADTDLTLDKDSLTFGPADWKDPQTVSVSAGQDDDTSDDTAALTHTASGGDYDAKTAEVSVTVEDDDALSPALVLSETALAMTEGAGTSYTVLLATQPTDTVTVSITGHASTDLSLDRTTLSFGTADWNDPQTVTVSAARDADEDEDTASLVHTATGGGYGGVAAELPVTVRDGIKISLAAGEAVEGSFMEVRFTLSSPSPGDVEVSWLTHPGGGNAHAGPVDDPDDFRMESGRLRFAAGETEVVREVWIVEDEIDDPHEQFTVQIDRPQGAVLADPVTSMPSLAQPDRRIELKREIAYVVVTILQAEAAPEPVEVTLEASPPTLEEGGRTLLWARLAEPLPEMVRIPLVWTEGTAEPDDHDGPSGLTIYAGHVAGRATLNALEDDDTDDETLSVSFGELPEWVVAGTLDSVEITILDNDGAGEEFAGLTVSVADASAREGEENLRFPVTLNRPAPGSVTVQASIDPNAGTARRGADYVDTSQQVRFETGDRLKFVTVLVEDDLVDEGEETLYLELSDARPSGVTIARSRAAGTIKNTDPMPAAWLSRFGRTVAEQALDGVSARFEASREPGWRGSLGGIPLGGGPTRGEETGAPNGPDGASDGLFRPGGVADDPFGRRPDGFGHSAISGHGAAPGHG